jgi:hypothetical protein
MYQPAHGRERREVHEHNRRVVGATFRATPMAVSVAVRMNTTGRPSEHRRAVCPWS